MDGNPVSTGTFTVDGSGNLSESSFEVERANLEAATAFVLSMARNMAVDQKIPVAIFSLEMSAIQMVMRLVASETWLTSDKLKKGNLISKSSQLTKNSISIGKELSFNLDLGVGDKVLIMSPVGIETIIGSLPRQETFIISSIFDSGLADFDANIAFINLNTLENFFNLKKEVVIR